MPDYLDTSAFVKLVIAERESHALRAELDASNGIISSALLVVEGRRAVSRHESPALGRAQTALAAINLLPVDDRALQAAAELPPPELRSLDALHLAAALSLGRDLERFFCYDARLGAAAAAHGLDVRSPA